jgi:hypothetical protein
MIQPKPRNSRIIGLLAIALCCSWQLFAQPFSDGYLSAMKYRMIGPHRGGRTVGAVGVPSQPSVFYMV